MITWFGLHLHAHISYKYTIPLRRYPIQLPSALYRLDVPVFPHAFYTFSLTAGGNHVRTICPITDTRRISGLSCRRSWAWHRLWSRTNRPVQRGPGTKVLLLSERDEQLHLDPVHWGYAPGWWDKPPLINARVETAATSRMFKPLWQHGWAILEYRINNKKQAHAKK